jgi:hypothetical protein
MEINWGLIVFVIIGIIFIIYSVFWNYSTCDNKELLTIGCFKSDFKYVCSESDYYNITMYSDYKIFCKGEIYLT